MSPSPLTIRRRGRRLLVLPLLLLPAIAVACEPVGTRPEDMALHRPVSSSSVQYAGVEADKAVDGNSTTRWSSVYSDNQTFTVDLGSTRRVGTVEVNWEKAYASEYRIDTSTDGTRFSAGATAVISSLGAKRTTFAARDARYVRLTAVRRATAWGISFWDFKVFGPGDTTPTLPPPTTTPPPPADVLWTGDLEEGTLADFDRDGNGGEYNSGSGDSVASPDVAHSGTYSAKMTVTAPAESGTRLFRWGESRRNRELSYEAWFFFPTAYTVTGGYWNIFQFKSTNQDRSRNDPFWFLNVVNPAPGRLRARLAWWYGHGVEGPHQGEAGWRNYDVTGEIDIPVGRWVKFRVFLRQSNQFDGIVRVWQHDVLVLDQTNVRTGHANTTYNSWGVDQGWAVNNYSDGLSPAPSSVYVDDLRITR